LGRREKVIERGMKSFCGFANGYSIQPNIMSQCSF